MQLSESQRKQIKQSARQLEALRAARTGDLPRFCRVLGFEPNEAQLAVLECLVAGIVKRICARWGRRAGKSVLAAVVAAFIACKINTRQWVLAPTHDLCGRVWTRARRIMCGTGPVEDTMPGLIGLGFRPVTDKKSPPVALEFEWGARLDGHTTTGAGVQSLEGESLDNLVWDECASSADVWQSHLAPCLADRAGTALFIGKPKGKNHFYDKCWLGDPKNQDREPRWQSFHFTSEVNFAKQPALRTEFEEDLRLWPRPRFDQEWLAKWTSFVGRVYPDFNQDEQIDRMANVQSWCRYNKDLPLAMAFDFGVADPFVCLWLQFTPSDDVWVIDEYYQANRSSPDNVIAVMEQHALKGYKDPMWFAADPSGSDEIKQIRRHTTVGMSYHRHAPGRRQIRWGIDEILVLLKGLYSNDLKRFVPRLFANPGCTNFIDEMLSYRYPEVRTEEKNLSEAPFDWKNHGPDALRYGIAVWLPRHQATLERAAASSPEWQSPAYGDGEAPLPEPPHFATGLEKLDRKREDILRRALAGGKTLAGLSRRV